MWEWYRVAWDGGVDKQGCRHYYMPMLTRMAVLAKMIMVDNYIICTCMYSMDQVIQSL